MKQRDMYDWRTLHKCNRCSSVMVGEIIKKSRETWVCDDLLEKHNQVLHRGTDA